MRSKCGRRTRGVFPMRSSTEETAPAGAEAEAGSDIRICDLVSPNYIGVWSLEARG
jgi:hypothetical protein